MNTVMPKSLRPYFDDELDQYRSALAANDCSSAWQHLERAHILGQRYPVPHTYVHWRMLLFGIKIKNNKEIIGQIPRLVFGGIKSFVGKIPTGNPGGANVPPLKTFPIMGDLQLILTQTTGVE